jgi:hypothetical protein
MDLHESICAWAEAPAAAGLQSRSLAGLCRGDEATDWRDCWVTESHGISGFLCTQRVLRWGSLSYCWSAGFPELLFDLASDPAQMQNLAGSPAAGERLHACRDRLDRWMVDERDPAREAFLHDRRLLDNSR